MLELKRALDDFISNIYDFVEELFYLLKEDWYKFKRFIGENKNYVLWVFVLLITMQFTDLASLGKSWERYCNKNNKNNVNVNSNTNANANQKGGGEDVVKQIEAVAPKKPDGGDAPKKPDGGPGDGQNDELKATNQKLSFFEGLKAKVKGSAGQHGMLGPVFSQSGRIFDSVGAIFVLIGGILVILGILTIPVLIFIVITYCVIKTIVGKFVNL